MSDVDQLAERLRLALDAGDTSDQAISRDELAEQLRLAHEAGHTTARAISLDGDPPQFGHLNIEARVTDIGGSFIHQVPTGYHWTLQVDGVIGGHGTILGVRIGEHPDRMTTTGEVAVSGYTLPEGAAARTTFTGRGPLTVDGQEMR
jgi:hypothetical protein